VINGNGRTWSAATIAAAVAVVMLLMNVGGWLTMITRMDAKIDELNRTCIRLESTIMSVDSDLRDVDRRVARLEGGP